jgi:hypothetical protein
LEDTLEAEKSKSKKRGIKVPLAGDVEFVDTVDRNHVYSAYASQLSGSDWIPIPTLNPGLYEEFELMITPVMSVEPT